MKNNILYIHLLILFSTFGCAQKSFGQYSEDLASYRPRYEEVIIDSIINKCENPVDSISPNPSGEVALVSSGNADIVNEKVEQVTDLLAQYWQEHSNVRGFRVEIYRGASENTAEEVKSQFKNLYGESQNVKIIWKNSRFHVLVGDFIEYLKAWQWYNKLKGDFRSPFLMRNETIDLNTLK